MLLRGCRSQRRIFLGRRDQLLQGVRLSIAMPINNSSQCQLLFKSGHVTCSSPLGAKHRTGVGRLEAGFESISSLFRPPRGGSTSSGGLGLIQVGLSPSGRGHGRAEGLSLCVLRSRAREFRLCKGSEANTSFNNVFRPWGWRTSASCSLGQLVWLPSRQWPGPGSVSDRACSVCPAVSWIHSGIVRNQHTSCPARIAGSGSPQCTRTIVVPARASARTVMT